MPFGWGLVVQGFRIQFFFGGLESQICNFLELELSKLVLLEVELSEVKLSGLELSALELSGSEYPGLEQSGLPTPISEYFQICGLSELRFLMQGDQCNTFHRMALHCKAFQCNAFR